MALGGGSAQQLIELQLRITAQNAAAFQQTAQGFREVDKQAARTASNVTRAFGPRLITSMGQVRGKLVEQGQALQAFGAELGQTDPRLQKTGARVAELGIQQTKAGQSGKVHEAVLRSQAAALSRASAEVQKLIPALQQQLQMQQAERAATEASLTAKQKKMAVNQQSLGIMQEEIALTQASITTLQGQSQALSQASAAQGNFATQTKNAALTVGSFGGEATMAQKAGQGMILSFSAAQASAGNFEQALFGLGFSLLFVGRGLLGWPLIIAGIVTALTVGIPIIKDWVFGTDEMGSASERASERVQKLEDALAEARGEAALFAEDMEDLFREKEFGELLAAQLADLQFDAGPIEQAANVINSTVADLQNTLRSAVDDAKAFLGLGFVPNLVGVGGAFQDAAVSADLFAEEQALLDEVQADGTVTTEEYIRVLTAFGATGGKAFDEIAAAGLAFADVLHGEAVEALKEFDEAAARSDRRRVAMEVFEGMQDDARAHFGALIETERESLSNQLEAIREGLKEQTDARKAALQIELQTIRDAGSEIVDARREALDKEIGVIKKASDVKLAALQESSRVEIEGIRDAANDRIDIRRESLQTELDAISDQSADAIQLIKDEADASIEISKDKVDELKKLQRELADELQDISSRRRTALGDIMQTEAEVAELEALIRKFGPDKALESELALRKARLKALEEEMVTLNEQANAAEQQIEGVEGQITAEEALQDQIKEARDERVKAEKDTTRTAQREAKKRADTEIDAINSVTDKSVRDARTRAEVAKDAIREVTDRAVRDARTKADTEIDETNRVTAASVAAATVRADGDITQAQRSARFQQKQARATSDSIIAGIQEEQAVRLGEISIARRQTTADLDRAEMIRKEVLPALADEFRLRMRIMSMQIASLPFGSEKLRQIAAFIRMANDTIFMLASLGLGPEAAALQIQALKSIMGFQGGGVVPGPPGAPKLIMAHGGEEVLTQEERRPSRSPAMLTSGQSVSVTLIIENLYMGSPADERRLERAISRGIGRKVSVKLRSTGRAMRGR